MGILLLKQQQIHHIQFFHLCPCLHNQSSAQFLLLKIVIPHFRILLQTIQLQKIQLYSYQRLQIIDEVMFQSYFLLKIQKSLKKSRNPFIKHLFVIKQSVKSFLHLFLIPKLKLKSLAQKEKYCHCDQNQRCQNII